jgi:3-hydroxyisobutyrate dehydrogenase-like beta-hydroxyacid dehydrogenase
MTFRTIAVVSAGDMGHAVGGALREAGFDVVTCLAGRSALTQERAKRVGLRALPDLDAVIAASDLFLSILPPALAPELAAQAAAAMRRTGNKPLYADMNAVSPETVLGVGRTIEAAGAPFVDGGIIGNPPGKGAPTKVYFSGKHAEEVAEALKSPKMVLKTCGAEPGRASAVKMCYAALTKGSNALFATVLTAAEALGVSPEIMSEYEASQPDLLKRMRASVPFLPADAWRYTGEMEEIAATFESVGVTPKFHLGAADLYRLLDTTPFAKETRESLDRSRTLEQSVKVYAEHLKKPKKAAAE